MRLVLATRVLNEDDVIEAFARHHAPMVDELLFLDNGSTDRSIEILRALRDEGLPVAVLQSRSASFQETVHLTVLHRYAAEAFAADWVVHLDADEFLDTRVGAGHLRARLADAEAHALRLRVIHYPQMPGEDAGELVVPARLTRREAALRAHFKLLVRGGADSPRMYVEPGCHNARLDGEVVAPEAEESLRIAHYPRRSPWQQISKAVIGRLKGLAGGRAVLEAQHGIHYESMLQVLRERPATLLADPYFLACSAGEEPLVDDPIRYFGGALRYTQHCDWQMKAVRNLAVFAEDLATQHGRLVDDVAGVSNALQGWTTQLVRLM